MGDDAEFTFVDLFAGIGGFHAALAGLGGRCLLASEIDPHASKVYERNWGLVPAGNIYEVVRDGAVWGIPKRQRIDVLTAGFPCQPFSKSGYQRGRTEARGTIFDQIAAFIEIRKPRVVLLENVRNFAGPRHRPEFERVIETLRSADYRVSSSPSVFSPHKIDPAFGGRPQVRERLFIAATHDPRTASLDLPTIRLDERVAIDSVSNWDIRKFLVDDVDDEEGFELSDVETEWLETWDEFVQHFRGRLNEKIPGHPLWSDEWRGPLTANQIRKRLVGLPDWKRRILNSNWSFYEANRRFIDSWRRRTRIDEFPASRRKFEWQAQEAGSVWECAIHMRPSGIRVRPFTYLPALVAMNQTSILGPNRRRITPREAAVLQGLPSNFDFGDQPLAQSYKQLGNGVNVGVVWQVMRSLVDRDRAVLRRTAPQLLEAVESSPMAPEDHAISAMKQLTK
jgi:DNA (cytosine-5)-methyltransferase 1